MLRIPSIAYGQLLRTTLTYEFPGRKRCPWQRAGQQVWGRAPHGTGVRFGIMDPNGNSTGRKLGMSSIGHDGKQIANTS